MAREPRESAFSRAGKFIFSGFGLTRTTETNKEEAISAPRSGWRIFNIFRRQPAQQPRNVRIQKEENVVDQMISGIRTARNLDKETTADRDNFIAANSQLEALMGKLQFIDTKKELADFNKELVEAQKEAIDTAAALSARLGKSGDKDTRGLGATLGQYAQKIAMNRLHTPNLINNMLNDFENNKINFRGKTTEQLLREQSAVKISDATEKKVLGAGAMNVNYILKDINNDNVVFKGGKHKMKVDDLTNQQEHIADMFDYHENKTNIAKLEDIYQAERKLASAKLMKTGEFTQAEVDFLLDSVKGAKGQAFEETDTYKKLHKALDGKIPREHEMNLPGDGQMYAGLKYEQDGTSFNGLNPDGTPRQTETFTTDSAFRDVATTRINKMLGLDVIVDTSISFSEANGASVAMALADGLPLYGCAGYRTDAEKQKLRDGGYKDKQIIDLEDNSLKQAYMELMVVDLLTGQQDRHGNNVFISGQPGAYKMTGIDNDFAFGLKPLPDTFSDRISPNCPTTKTALPYITTELRDKVMSIDKNDYKNMLTGLVDTDKNGKERVDWAVYRLEQFQDKLRRNEIPCYDTIDDAQADIKADGNNPFEKQLKDTGDENVLQTLDYLGYASLKNVNTMKARQYSVQSINDRLDKVSESKKKSKDITKAANNLDKEKKSLAPAPKMPGM